MVKSPNKANQKPTVLPKDKQGQALAEYALILALGILGLAAILTILAPAVGNVFSNTVYNLLGQTTTPQDPLSADEFWDVVTAVSSYTPEAPALVTNTALPNTPLPTNTVVTTPTNTIDPPTATYTVTPGPSPTPEDQDYDYPFTDNADDEDKFYDEPPDILSGIWDAEYWEAWWDGDGGGDSHCNGGNRFDANTGTISQPPEATYQVDVIDFPNASLPSQYWDQNWQKPHPDVSGTDFCSRFETTMTLDAGDYTFRYNKDDGVRIYVIDDTTSTVERVVNDWDWWPSYNNSQTVSWTNTSTGSKTIRIVHRDTGGGAYLTVELLEGETSSPNCNWELDDRYSNSAPTSWHDSLSGNYNDNTTCILNLRGTIDLTGSTEPGLTFYERYAIGSGDVAEIGISIAGSGDWKTYTLHTGTTSNLSWEQNEFSLSAFADDAAAIHDFRDEVIEIRFVLRTDGWGRADGWWLDDISVIENPETVYYVGFNDDAEGGIYWNADGDWDRTTEYARSGSQSWTDRPNGNYRSNTDTSLTLDGRIDLSSDSPVPVSNPELVFWHGYRIYYTTDRISVEYSLDKVNWTKMATRSVLGNTAEGDPIVENYLRNEAFAQVIARFPAAAVGQSNVYIRFRLETDGWGTDRGWWIDDIEIRNRIEQTVTVGFCDTFESGLQFWTPSGEWGLSTSNPYRGNQRLEDSVGSGYDRYTDYSIELIPYIDLNGGLTRPVFEFYHQWDVGDDKTTDTHMILEISQDDGMSWIPLYDYEDDVGHPYYGSSVMAYPYEFDEMDGWHHEVVELAPYIGFPSAMDDVPGLKMRFRLYAPGYNTDSGWQIDNFCIKDLVPPTINLPFADDMEAGDGNWYANADWELSDSESSNSGSYAWTESLGRNTRSERFHTLELIPTIDLTGAGSPVLNYWLRYRLGNPHLFRVEYIRTNANGERLTDWEALGSTLASNTRNDAWTRFEVDLTPYVGQYIRIRFHYDATRSWSSSRGVHLDDVSIVDRFEDTLYPINYFENVEVIGFGEWVLEDEWDLVTVNRQFSSNSLFGPGQWDVTYYANVSDWCTNSALLDASSITTTTTVDEIDFNWGGGRPSEANFTDSNANDDWGVSYRRTVFFTDETDVTFSGIMDNSLQLIIDGNIEYRRYWTSCAGEQSFNYTHTFVPGIYEIELQYYEHAGSARITLDLEADSQVFTDSPSGNYDHAEQSSIELEGAIDLAGTTNPVMFFDQAYYIDGSDELYVDISTDGGFTWNLNVYNAPGTGNLNWSTAQIDLSAYAGQQITPRFRIETLDTWGSLRDGWYIDNIRVVE